MSSVFAGLRVLELAHEVGALAGKLFADMGAEVIVVEPPGGSRMRSYGPFLDDVPGPERSLYWWHYNTSKLGITLDLDAPQDRERFRQLVASADVWITCETPRRLAELGLDYADVQALRPELILVSITPFGRDDPRSEEPFTDLTLLAGGGPVWMCGYDDHSLPPVRGGGNQGYQTACHFAVMSALVALLARERTGRGQLVDVNAHACANVTTEAGSYDWLVARRVVQRQTGRHAAAQPTMPAQIQCADGRWVSTGVPPRSPAEFRAVYEWIQRLGGVDAFPEAVFLEMGMNRERIDLSKIFEDEEVRAIFGAGREAMNFIAERVSAYEFFVGAQQRGISVGIIYSPDEVIEDPHFRERGFPVEVRHDELGRSFVYPGAPYRFERTPWKIQRRAPLLGEHNEAILASLPQDQGEVR